MKQKIDHNDTNSKEFLQRYWKFDDNWGKKEENPIFLYICGESRCTGVRDDYVR
jgi:hypothetical protein